MKAMWINLGLVTFQRGCFKAGSLKKPMTGGDPFPKDFDVDWNASALNISLRDAFNGMAKLSFLFNMSQHPDNGPESFCTLKIGEQCKDIRANVIKPKKKGLDVLIKKAKEEQAEFERTYDNLLPEKQEYRILMIHEQKAYLDVYQKLMDMG